MVQLQSNMPFHPAASAVPTRCAQSRVWHRRREKTRNMKKQKFQVRTVTAPVATWRQTNQMNESNYALKRSCAEVCSVPTGRCSLNILPHILATGRKTLPATTNIFELVHDCTYSLLKRSKSLLELLLKPYRRLHVSKNTHTRCISRDHRACEFPPVVARVTITSNHHITNTTVGETSTSRTWSQSNLLNRTIPLQLIQKNLVCTKSFGLAFMSVTHTALLSWVPGETARPHDT